MQSLAINEYPAAAVRAALHAAEGSRRVSYRYELITAHGVRREADLRVTPGGSLSINSKQDIQRTARIEMIDPGVIDWQNDMIKIYFVLRMPDGGKAEWPLGVFYMPTAPRTNRAGMTIRALELYDASMILRHDATTNRLYYPLETPYTDAIDQILTGAGIAKRMITPASDYMRTDREWGINTPKADIIKTLLLEINYTPLYVDGDGIFRSSRYRADVIRQPDYTYNADTASVISPGGTVNDDSFSIPNVFSGVVSNPEIGEMHFTYENKSPTSPVSIPNRNGRKVSEVITYTDISSIDVLEQTVRRIAEERTRAYETISLSTAAMPHHESGDCLDIDIPLVGGRFIETAWTLTLKAGAGMTHTAERMVSL